MNPRRKSTVMELYENHNRAEDMAYLAQPPLIMSHNESLYTRLGIYVIILKMSTKG